MITPEWLDRIIRGTEEQVSYINNIMVRRIAKRVRATFTNSKTGNLFMPSTIKDMHKLMAAGMLAEDIEKSLYKELPDLQKEITKAFKESAKEISDYNNTFTGRIITFLKKKFTDFEVDDYEKDGIPKNKDGLKMTAAEIRKLQQIYDKTNRVVKNYCNTVPLAGQDLYVTACDNAFMKAQSGISIDTAISEAIEEAAEQGIRVVSYKGTRTDRLEVAIARAVRTGVNKANSEIVLTRAGELGVSYVKVSSHLGARVTKFEDYTNHAHWQGKVYKLDYTSPELQEFASAGKDVPAWASIIADQVKEYEKVTESSYTDFIKVTGYGKLLGLAGVNCRHTFSTFFPGIHDEPEQQFDSDENKKNYDMSQKQRAMERAIRDKKRKVDALTAADVSPERVKELKSQLKNDIMKYSEYCSDNNLSRANWRLQI